MVKIEAKEPMDFSPSFLSSSVTHVFYPLIHSVFNFHVKLFTGNRMMNGKLSFLECSLPFWSTWKHGRERITVAVNRRLHHNNHWNDCHFFLAKKYFCHLLVMQKKIVYTIRNRFLFFLFYNVALLTIIFVNFML